MNTERKLKDTISALLMSYFIIVSIFQVTSRFLDVTSNVCIAVAGLILAVIFLFVNPDNRRTMRIVSIACNSIAIGSIIGVLYSALNIVLPMLMCIIISSLFIGFTFLIYYLIYIVNGRVVSAILCGGVIISLILMYYFSLYHNLENIYNYYIIIMAVMTIIHYIVAIIVVHSDKNSIITGMSYGYFGITIAVIIVVAIFLLIASEGDIDLDLSSDGGSTPNKSSKVSSKATSKIEKTSSKNDTVSKVIDRVSKGGPKSSKIGNAVASIDPCVVADVIDVSLEGFDAIMNALVVQGIEPATIVTLQDLDRIYKQGIITKEQYFTLRDELFPDL